MAFLATGSLTYRSISFDFSKPLPACPLRWHPQRSRRDGANGTRLHVLKLVAVRGPIRSIELAMALGISRRAVLYHLRILVELGLVVRVYPRARSPFQAYVIPSYLYSRGRLAHLHPVGRGKGSVGDGVLGLSLIHI